MSAQPSVTRTGSADSFAYTPPARIFRTERVLLIAAPDVHSGILATVIRGFWRFSPITRTLVTAHPKLEDWMLGANMGVVDLDEVPKRPYVPPGGKSSRPVIASHMLADCDGCVTLVRVDPAQLDLPPSLLTMAGLVTGNTDLGAVYRALSPYFAGAIVQVGDKVVWGDDILDVDATAYRLAGKPPHPLIAELRSASHESA